MIEEFHTLDELYERVLPALNTRVCELENLGVKLKIEDIWSYLVTSKWRFGIDLTLFDVVDDILNTDYSKILDYINSKS